MVWNLSHTKVVSSVNKVLLTIALAAILYALLFDFMRWVHFDIPSFIGGARYLVGENGGFDYQSRLTKPLVLLLPAWGEHYLGIHPINIFLFQNLLCLFGAAWFLYKSLELLFQQVKFNSETIQTRFAIIRLDTNAQDLAYIGLIAYLGCQCVAIFSLTVLSDMPGWLAGNLGIYLTFKLLWGKELKSIRIVGLGAYLGLAIFTKENAVIALITLAVFTLGSSTLSWANKFKIAFLSFIGFSIVIASTFAWSEYYFGDSIWQRTIEVQHQQGFVFYNRSNILQVWHILDQYWILIPLFFIAGFWKQTASKGLFINLLIVVLITLILFPIAYPFIVERLLFLVAPLLLPFVVISALFFERYTLPIVMVGGALNLIAARLMYLGYAHTIPVAALIYVLILLTTFFLLNKKYYAEPR